MTKHQNKLKNIRRIIYILFAFIFWALLFCNVESDLWAGSCLGLSFTCTIIFIYSFKSNKKTNKLVLTAIENNIQKNAIPLDKIKEIYKYDGLDTQKSKILKLYFNSDYTKRCVIVQESNAVCIRFENLYFHNDKTKVWTMNFANWETDYQENKNSLYSDIQTAIDNNKVELENFVENDFVQNREQVLSTEITWKKIDINSNLLPFGLKSDFKLETKTKETINCKIFITNWTDTKNCCALLYLNESNKIDSTKNHKFKIYDNDKFLGFARCYKN